jgi:hypothetical protein
MGADERARSHLHKGRANGGHGEGQEQTFVTRNTGDVARTGVRLLNPFDPSA